MLIGQLDHRLVDLSQDMIESAAMRVDEIERSMSETDKFKLDTISTEYYMLRIYLVGSPFRNDVLAANKPM
jgi:hypothetical protein